MNLWRAAEFTGGVDVVVQSPTVAAAADVLQQGSPALLSLALSATALRRADISWSRPGWRRTGR